MSGYVSRDAALTNLALTRDMRGEDIRPQDDIEEWVMGCLTGAVEIAARDDVFATDYASRVSQAKARIQPGRQRSGCISRTLAQSTAHHPEAVPCDGPSPRRPQRRSSSTQP